MGKLGDLWSQLREMNKDDPRRKEIQDEINKIERYCIKQGYEGFTSETKWYDGGNQSEIYPFHTGTVYLEDLNMVGSLNGKGINYEADGSVHKCEVCQ